MTTANLHKKRIEQQFRKSIATYNSQAKVQDIISQHLINYISQYGFTTFKQVLEIGAGTGLLTQKLLQSFNIQTLWLNDLVREMQIPLTELCSSYNNCSINFVMGDAEKIPLPQNNDLIISSSTIQWFENIETFLDTCHKSISPGGILALSTFGSLNMKEIQCITNTALEYHNLEFYRNILRPKFEVLQVTQSEITVHFTTPTDILQHIKQTGVNSIKPARWTKKDVIEFSNQYLQFYNPKLGFELTYNPVYIVCRKT